MPSTAPETMQTPGQPSAQHKHQNSRNSQPAKRKWYSFSIPLIIDLRSSHSPHFPWAIFSQQRLEVVPLFTINSDFYVTRLVAFRIENFQPIALIDNLPNRPQLFLGCYFMNIHQSYPPPYDRSQQSQSPLPSLSLQLSDPIRCLPIRGLNPFAIFAAVATLTELG